MAETSFAELGIDPCLIHALNKKGIVKPTPVQREAIPIILEGKDLVVSAETGSGKTFAYVLPLIQKLSHDSGTRSNIAPIAFIVVPTRELCHQVYSELLLLIKLCRLHLKTVQLSSSMSPSDLQAALAGPPDILVSTPACVHKCLSEGVLQITSINVSLKILVLDEADLLLSYGYEDDLKALTSHVPRSCQCLLISSTFSADVEKLKKFFLHNFYTLSLVELGEVVDENNPRIPRNIRQFWISCSARDKFVHVYVLLSFKLVQEKVLIFTNTIDTSYRLKLFLEKLKIKSAVLNAELPQNSRSHILKEFNAGCFSYLIANDGSRIKDKGHADGGGHLEPKKSREHGGQKLDSEFGVARGIDFKNVHTVINFEFPQSADGYVHRIGRTGRAFNAGTSISLVSPNEMEMFEEIKSILWDSKKKNTNPIAPFPALSKCVESVQYRAENMARSDTKVAVREARAQDLRNELLNSEKLKAHFKVNPRDLDLLRHDKGLSKKPPPHSTVLADYIVESTRKELSRISELAIATENNANNSARGQRSRRNSRKRSNDPLKTFSAAEDPKDALSIWMKKRKGEEKDDTHRLKKKQY